MGLSFVNISIFSSYSFLFSLLNHSPPSLNLYNTLPFLNPYTTLPSLNPYNTLPSLNLYNIHITNPLSTPIMFIYPYNFAMFSNIYFLYSLITPTRSCLNLYLHNIITLFLSLIIDIILLLTHIYLLILSLTHLTLPI